MGKLSRKNKKIYLIGAGPGDPELLTLKALHAIKKSDAILYDQLINPEILKYARKSTKLVFVGKKKGLHIIPQEKINELLVELAEQHPIVSRLKGGDPFIFGRGGEELEFLTRQGFSCEVIPGITAASGAAAAIQIPLSHRDYSSEIVLITGHKKMDGDYRDFSAIELKKRTVVIYMGVTALPEIIREIGKKEENKNIPLAIVRCATRNEQQLIRGTVGTIEKIIEKRGLEPPAVIIIGEIVSFLDEMQSIREKI